MKTIDVTPTWEGLVPAFLALIENGTPEGRAMAVKEITRMAQIADHAVAEAKRMDAERKAERERLDHMNDMAATMKEFEA